MNLKIVFISLLSFVIFDAFSQMNPGVKSAIEKYLETTESNADYTQILEDLTAFLESPLNLNTATAEELMRFPLITPVQATQIISHRNKFGPFLQIAELQVLGFSIEQIQVIKPFVSLTKNMDQQWKEIIHSLPSGTKELVTTAKQKYPVTNNPDYAGNMLSQNLRLRYSKTGMYSFGLSTDKDAGEAYWNKGPDFYSGHAAIYNLGKIKSLVVGDYLLSLGQGLVMGSGIGMGKSALVLNIKRNAPELKAYRGVNEYFFQRGIASQIQWNKWGILLAISQNKTDARLTDSNAFGNVYISTLDIDGYHRTPQEIAGKHNISQSMIGTWISRKTKRGNWGAGGNFTQFNKPVQTSGELYKLYYPTGNNLSFFNIYQAHTLGRIHLFSEWAWCATNHTAAGVAGLLTSLGKNIDLSLLYRNYASGFVSRFNTAFGNSNQNEKGIYAGIVLKFTRKISLSHYTDVWTNPWLGYRIYGPGRGTDMLWQLDYTPTKKSQFYVRFRTQNKPGNADVQTPYKSVVQQKIQSFRLHVTLPVSKNSEIQLRGENNQAWSGSQWYRASMTFCQFAAFIPGIRTQISMRYNLFDVPWYYSRIYAFENQLMYDFGTMAFYGKGSSTYILISQKISRNWKCGLRYSWQQSISTSETQLQTKQGIFVQLFYQK